MINSKAALLAAGISLCSQSWSEASKPEFYGVLDGGLQKIQDTTDIDGTAFQIVAGFKGKYQDGDLTIVYQVESELQDIVNDDDGQGEVKITSAMMVLPSRYGTVLIAPRAVSGEVLNIYRVVDFFENSQVDTTSGMWGQPREASSAFVYETPKVANIKAGVAVLTLAQVDPTLDTNSTNKNDNTFDVVATQLVYGHKGYSAAVGVVGVNKDQLPDWIDETYYRNSLGLGYAKDQWKVGLLYETNIRHPLGDFDTTALAFDYRFNDGWSASLGLTRKVGGDAPDGAPAAVTTGQGDETLKLVTVRKHLGGQAYAYAEMENYANANDEYSLGLKIQF